MAQLQEGTSLVVGSHKVTVGKFVSEGGFSKIYTVTMDPKEQGSEIGCLKQVIVPDKAGLNTLRKEVDVMKTLRYARSIVRHYDSNAERLANGAYQVLVLMEFCPNKSLLDYMNARIRQKLTEKEILKIMLDICVGVYEMHKLKLVHRDIKIENVLIDAENHFKLCDFGSVAAPVGPPKNQQEFNFLSHDILYHTTPQYRCPEMIDLYRGFPIDERSDIWALGCFLYKLCYYTTPFEANGEIAILHALFQFPAAPAFSGDLKNLIIIMLQENPLYRPNIVQILMLLARIVDIDFADLAIDDFYHAGEYSFQALHEMQRQKHNELMKQQHYYFEQQKQQAEYKLKHAHSSHPLHPSIDEHLHTSSDLQKSLSHSHAASLKSSGSIKSAASVKSAASAKSIDSHLSDHEPQDKDSDSDVDFAELANLEDAEVRYPSLDVLDAPLSDLSLGDSKSAPLEKDGKLEAPIINEDLSIDPADTVLSKKPSKPSEYEKIEAWQKPVESSMDEKAEKLVEEIFVARTGPSSAKPVEPVKSSKSATDLPLGDYSQTSPREYLKRPSVEVEPNPLEQSSVPPVAIPSAHIAPHAAQLLNMKQSQSYDSRAYRYPVVKDESRKEGFNPWGDALEKTARPEPKASNNVVPQFDLGLPVLKLNLDERPAPEVPNIEQNLIELEVGLSSSSSDIPPPLPPHPPIKYEEVSLLDLDMDEKIRKKENKTVFKKRISDIQNQPLAFQEQVIDFASDDENNNSEMSRVAIRKELRKPKSRKPSSDHKRTESHSERKRLSFFGGSD